MRARRFRHDAIAGRSSARRVLAAAVLVATACVLTGCGAVWRSATRTHDVAPSGLAWSDEFLRRALVMGTFDQALALTDAASDDAPDDLLLRELFRGQVAFYAGDWAQSTAALAEADRLTEERYTKSASRGVLAMLTNDHALKYVPARTERLFSPYYAMLARVQSGDIAGATGDARRLSALLERAAGDVEPEERATHAALRDVAGAVFEAAGEWNDAGVAYRNAAVLRGASPAAVEAMRLSAVPDDSATLILVVESGFVAHYVEQTLALPTGVGHASPSRRAGATEAPDDEVWIASESAPDIVPSAGASDGEASWIEALDALPDGGVFLDADGDASNVRLASAPSTVTDDWTPRARRHTRYLGDRGWSHGWLQISWPSLARPHLPEAPVSLLLDGPAAAPQIVSVPADGDWVADVSDAVGADARRLRTARLARLTARTVTRMAAIDEVDDRHGPVAAAVAGLFASALERADTRAWHLLPGRLTVVRVTVPAGRTEPALRVGATANNLPEALAAFDAKAGAVYIRTARVWRDPAGSPVTTLAQQEVQRSH